MRDHIRFAGLLPRILAMLVDFLVFCAVFFPATRLLKGVWMMSATDHRWSQSAREESGIEPNIVALPTCQAA